MAELKGLDNRQQVGTPGHLPSQERLNQLHTESVLAVMTPVLLVTAPANTVISGATYVGINRAQNMPLTPEGAAFSLATGAAMGHVGNALGAAAGGGVGAHIWNFNTWTVGTGISTAVP